MKKIFLIILTISTLNAAGHNHWIGLKGGVNLGNAISRNFLSQNGSRTGLVAGMTYEHLFKNQVSVGADLIYNQRGFTNGIVFTDDLGNPMDGKFTSKFNYNYLSLPFKAGFNFGNKLYGFANIGVVPSLLLSAKTISPTFNSSSHLVGSETTKVTNRVSKFDFAGLVEIGAAIKLNERYCLSTSASFQHSFTSITNSEYFANSKITHFGLTLSLGLKYALIDQ